MSYSPGTLVNLSKIRSILLAALCAGLAAGILLSIIQSKQVIPTLLDAEIYEEKAVQANSEQSNSFSNKFDLTHQNETSSWQPRNGWERIFFTMISNVCLAVGFALLLGAAIHLRGGVINWWNGLFWGLGGYTTFFVAPSLGLPPELPGTETASLNDRQFWWIMTMFDTAAGLWLLFFAKSNANKILGAILLMTPHFLGAPHPTTPSSAAPDELQSRFIVATAVTNAVFWIAMGMIMGLYLKKSNL